VSNSSYTEQSFFGDSSTVLNSFNDLCFYIKKNEKLCSFNLTLSKLIRFQIFTRRGKNEEHTNVEDFFSQP
jgi:hypothetical protein